MTEPPLDPTTVATVAAVLARARRVLVITGAGVSAESGLPTYRGVGGLYDSGPTADGVPIEEALSGAMMSAQPALTWKYMRQIEETCRGARPNRAHEIIAAIEQRIAGTWVLTQNVDGLHQAAGSRQVIEIHGNMRRLRCERCPAIRTVTDWADLPVDPRCAACGAPERPDVVLFGELLPPQALETLHDEIARGFDVVFVVGTTAVFPYVQAPVVAALRARVPTVEINPGNTILSALVRHRLPVGAGQALAAVWGELETLTS